MEKNTLLWLSLIEKRDLVDWLDKLHIISITLFCLGLISFCTGFHNIDTAWNLKDYEREIKNNQLFDRVQVYDVGTNQTFLSIILFLLSFITEKLIYIRKIQTN